MSLMGSMAAPVCLNPVTNFNPLVSYFPSGERLVATDLNLGDTIADESSTVQFAELFEVTYHNAYKVVRTTIPSFASHEYVLYQCGTPQPDASAFWSNATFFQVPVSKAATGSSIPAAFMEDLGLAHRLHLVDGAIISSSCLLKQISECENMTHASIGTTSWPDNDPNEAMLSWRETIQNNDEIGVVFTDSWGTGQSVSAKDVSFDASLDKGTLKTAEWLLFVSLFFNAEAKAIEVFQDEVRQVAAIRTAVEVAAAEKPSVAWAQSGSFPPTDIYATHYRKEFVTMAGGTNAFEVASKPANSTVLMEALKGVQILIDETYNANPHQHVKASFMQGYGITDAMIASGDWPFLTNELVFRVDKHHGDGSYDSAWGGKSYPLEWFARRNTNPNEFVADLAFAINPALFPQYSNTYFLRNLMKDEGTVMNTASMCTDFQCAASVASVPAPPPPSDSAAGKVVPMMAAAVALAVAYLM